MTWFGWKSLIAALVLSVFAVPSEVKADLIEVNHTVFGTASVTGDTDSGLEWLDLNLSENRSYNDITGVDGSDEFAVGGDFEGFRYASVPEVEVLWAHAGITLINTPSTTLLDPIVASQALIGFTWPQTEPFNWTLGITSTVLSDTGFLLLRTTPELRTGLHFRPSVPAATAIIIEGLRDDIASPDYGS